MGNNVTGCVFDFGLETLSAVYTNTEMDIDLSSERIRDAI
jgi:hypothetical protein